VGPLTAAEMAARDSYGRLLALLSAATRDVAAAEDALADAFERAVRTWPEQGVPAKPEAWLLTVARNRLRDWSKSSGVRRTTSLDTTQDAPVPVALVHLDEIDPNAIPDRRLELMLVCAHPAIDSAVHTPLMLNTVLGHTAEQVGRAYSIPATTMATRLVRAKRRIKAAGIPFRIPGRDDLPPRMDAVLEAVYGAHVIEFGRAHRVPSEALHLAQVLAQLAPDHPEVRGLAALVQLSAARAAARTGADGRFVRLADQRPSDWDQQLIARAHEHLRAAHARGRLGRFQLEAAIQAVHCTPGPNRRTLLDLHRALHRTAPSLGGAVALAAATAEVDGPEAGLAALDELVAGPSSLDRGRAPLDAGPESPGARFQPARATRAHLLERLGRTEEAATEYDAAIALTSDPAERRYLTGRRGKVAAG
jgi:predicted RNA polymerase sigma factor